MNDLYYYNKINKIGLPKCKKKTSNLNTLV